MNTGLSASRTQILFLTPGVESAFTVDPREGGKKIFRIQVSDASTKQVPLPEGPTWFLQGCVQGLTPPSC